LTPEGKGAGIYQDVEDNIPKAVVAVCDAVRFQLYPAHPVNPCAFAVQ
jgi:hypothetical protein